MSVVVMAASAAVAVLVVIMVMTVLVVMIVVRMGMAVALAMAVSMIVMMMLVGVAVMVVTMVVVAHMGAALRLEGALDRGGRAALSAHQLGEGRVVLHIKRVVRHLEMTMVAAEMPGEAHETNRVLGPYLQKLFGGSLDLNEPSVLKAQSVSVVDGGLHIEIEMDLGAPLTLQMSMPAISRLMVEGHRVDDTVGLHGGLADDGGDAGHGFSQFSAWSALNRRVVAKAHAARGW